MMMPGYAAPPVDPLIAKIKPYEDTKGWKQLKQKVSSIFREADANDIGYLDFDQVKWYFDKVGYDHFGQCLGNRLTRDLFERFDFDGSWYLDELEAFRCLRNTLQSIYLAGGGKMPEAVALKTPEQNGMKLIKELARGGQGSAWLAESDKYGKVALKVYDKVNPNACSIAELIDEMKALTRLSNSEHIMKAHEIFQDAGHLYCVNELLPGGDLESLREKAQEAGIALTEDYFRHIFYQCCKGVHHIHMHALMHCDIKEPNMMIRNKDIKNPQIAIIDLGLAQYAAGPGMAGGTPGYRPPETNANNVWYPRGDTFSLGVTFFQLLSGMVPSVKYQQPGLFQEGATSMEDVIRFTATRPVPWQKIQGSYPNCRGWLEGMLRRDKDGRPMPAQVYKDSDWFNSARGEDSEAEDDEGDDSENDTQCKNCTIA
jgi:serine/threonine protein kinase